MNSDDKKKLCTQVTHEINGVFDDLVKKTKNPSKLKRMTILVKKDTFHNIEK